MTPLLRVTNKKMNTYMAKFAKTQEVFETKDVCGRFVIDALASCAFGVETGSFDGEDSEFVRHAKDTFDLDGSGIFKWLIGFLTPTIVKKAAAKMLQK